MKSDAQDSILDLYIEIWKKVHLTSNARKISSFNEAIDIARNLGRDNVHVLVTGSMYLVGEAIRVLGKHIA